MLLERATRQLAACASSGTVTTDIGVFLLDVSICARASDEAAVLYEPYLASNLNHSGVWFLDIAER